MYNRVRSCNNQRAESDRAQRRERDSFNESYILKVCKRSSGETEERRGRITE